MLPALSVLIELQALDSALEAAHKRLADFPAAEKVSTQQVTAATAQLDAAKAAFNESAAARKLVEKDVAGVDTRLARFEEHKSAVKTNEQFHALQHEMEMGKQEKAELEERVLILMMEADTLAAAVKEAEGHVAAANKALAAMKAEHAKDRGVLEAEIARLQAERASKTPGVDKAALAKYEQLLKGRRGIAISQMVNGGCMACHMGLRPAVQAQVKRNDALNTCENCQRILYYVAPAADASSGASQ
jgi:predicted  nucleic acid-binding Zn-ribbon protein